MIRNVFSEIGGIGIYGIVSMLIFIAFFIGMIIWVLTMKKSHAERMSSMALEVEDKTEPTGADHHE